MKLGSLPTVVTLTTKVNDANQVIINENYTKKYNYKVLAEFLKFYKVAILSPSHDNAHLLQIVDPYKLKVHLCFVFQKLGIITSLFL